MLHRRRFVAILRLLVVIAALPGCGGVSKSSVGSYGPASTSTRYASIDGRLFAIDAKENGLAMAELAGGERRPVGTTDVDGRILRIGTVSESNQAWVAATICSGEVVEDDDNVSCADGEHVQILKADASGRLDLVADSGDRVGRSENERLDSGPYLYRGSVLIGVVDSVDGTASRLLLSNGSFEALDGDDGTGRFCATTDSVFRVTGTPDCEASKYVGLGLQRWDDGAWKDVSIDLNDTVYDLGLSCTAEQAVVLLQQAGGGRLTVVDGPSGSVRLLDAGLITGPTTVGAHGGDPTNVVMTTVETDSDGASLTTSLVEPDHLETLIEPHTPDDPSNASVAFVVEDGAGGHLAGIVRFGGLKVDRVHAR